MFKKLRIWTSRVVTNMKKLVKKVVGYLKQVVEKVLADEEASTESTKTSTQKPHTGVILLETTYVVPEVEVLAEEEQSTFTATVLRLITQWIESPPRKPPQLPSFNR